MEELTSTTRLFVKSLFWILGKVADMDVKIHKWGGKKKRRKGKKSNATLRRHLLRRVFFLRVSCLTASPFGLAAQASLQLNSRRRDYPFFLVLQDPRSKDSYGIILLAVISSVCSLQFRRFPFTW